MGKRHVVAAGLAAMLGLGALQVDGIVASAQATNTGSSTDVVHILAESSLEGSLAKYIPGVNNSGKATLHYEGKSLGVEDFDNANLLIKMPSQFKHITLHDEFLAAVSGEISTPYGTKKITPNDLKIYSDRIVVSFPQSFFTTQGKYRADIVLDFGKILKKYPNIQIDGAASGYQFSSTLVFASSLWDIIEDPIFGSLSGDYTTNEIEAVVK
ncbi:hypothetical protein PGRAN_07526 [Listeria grandensis FSL F6-0971]|uniref:Uncharacterized protein n=1 Tax=Listeria grandensis FSL F6-0971 TaxID=1265819 RepID=W7BFW8_9LIST|nr:hypothetical protein [Listeria grandensis]EUJ23735.1 hypothetical protein PGRAN_07526 [Listeria grandensis FSL F6-0971]